MRQYTTHLAAALFLITSLGGCPSHTRMPAAEQDILQDTLTHRSRQLAVSMYSGPFFRDSRYVLLSDQPPGDVDLLRSPKGAQMHPGEPAGILPAGTVVRVAAVQFANSSTVSTRSLLTPRFFTWVLLELPGEDRRRVIVIRDEPDSHQRFLEILERYVTTEDIAAKLASYPEDVRSAVQEKRLVSGMDADAVRMAWGNPLQVTRGFNEGVQVDVWAFEGGRREAYLDDDVLQSWTEEAHAD